VAGHQVTLLEDVRLSIPRSKVRFAETHPADDDEVVTGLTEVIRQLASQVSAATA
jgi:glycine cleavage system protein P-like pyridoxal-binding family